MKYKLTESQLNRVIKESVKEILKESNDEIWYEQETIGGWRQNPMFSGSYQECLQYL